MAKRKKKTGTKKKANKKKARKVSFKGARKKGHDFERWIANEIGHVFPEAKRHLEYQADEAQEGVDLAGTGVYDIQAKNLQNYVSIKTIKEVRKKKGRRPVLITKGNKMEPMVVMRFTDWVLMLEEIRGRELSEKTPFQQHLTDTVNQQVKELGAAHNAIAYEEKVEVHGTDHPIPDEAFVETNANDFI